MDMRTATVILFLVGTTFGLEELPLANPTQSNTQLNQDSQLDVFTDLLAHKYADSSKLKLDEFTSLWTKLVGIHNETSPQTSIEESLCIKALGQSPICQLMTRVI